MTGRVRKFDHDEARVRRANGETYAAIARSYGVNPHAIQRVCDDRIRQQDVARTAAWQRAGTCPDCGAPATRIALAEIKQMRCRACATARSRTSVLPTVLHCGTCDLWLPDDSFGRSNLAKHAHRRERRPCCRACETAARRERRRIGGWHK